MSLVDGIIDCLEHNENHTSLTKQESNELKRIRVKTHLVKLQLKTLLERQTLKQKIIEYELLK